MSQTAERTAKLLIVDQDPTVLRTLSSALTHLDLEVLTTSDSGRALEIVERTRPQIVVTDTHMPQMNGMDMLHRIMKTDPSTHVILTSQTNNPEAIATAIRHGASDYLLKPLGLGLWRDSIGRRVADTHTRILAQQAEASGYSNAAFSRVIGRSPRMCEMLSRLQRVAPHYRCVLITGKTGTGKDLLARALHDLSPASRGHYVVLNCSAVVETLFESELFGHVRGAFTGATADKPGLFEHADGGTLFLDEIGDMPLSTQAKLLRVLQNQEVLRVGALTPHKVNVRVIAATNRDLRVMMAEKTFREDLFYRLSMVEIQVPELADRAGDLPVLERFFVSRFADQYRKTLTGITPRARFALSSHRWPGNVRELENVIGHAAMMAASETIDICDLPAYLTVAAEHMTSDSSPDLFSTGGLNSQERKLLLRALETAAGNKSEAARILCIGRDAFRYKLKKHNLDREEPEHAAAAVA